MGVFTYSARGRSSDAGAFIVVLVLQLDIIAVLDRLSLDDQFRNAVVSSAAKSLSDSATQASTNTYKIDTHSYYNLRGTAGLVTLPKNSAWVTQLKDPRKYPGMLIAVLLISLGAPFWYNVLKDLIGLRSTLAQTDDQQRTQRQLGQGGGS